MVVPFKQNGHSHTFWGDCVRLAKLRTNCAMRTQKSMPSQMMPFHSKFCHFNENKIEIYHYNNIQWENCELWESLNTAAAAVNPNFHSAI